MEIETIELVTEAAQSIDYQPYLEAILNRLDYMTGFWLFLVVVLLCYFSYKFLRIFF